MVQFCCVLGCGNRSKRDRKKFFRLPIIPKACKSEVKIELLLRRRKQWLDNINREDLIDGDSNYSPGYIRVCSDHFHTGLPSKLTEVDHPDWSPTVKMGRGRIRIKGPKSKKIEYVAIYGKTGRQRLKKEIDDTEIETRRRLALYTEISQKKNEYRNVARMKKKAVRKKKELVAVQQQKLRIAKKTFMRENPMNINMSELDSLRRIPAMASETIVASSLNPMSTNAIIHKIVSDSVLLGDSVSSLEGDNAYKNTTLIANGDGEAFDEISNSGCDELQMINEIMNEHLSSLKTQEFKQESVSETADGQLLYIKSEIKVEPSYVDS